MGGNKKEIKLFPICLVIIITFFFGFVGWQDHTQPFAYRYLVVICTVTCTFCFSPSYGLNSKWPFVLGVVQEIRIIHKY